MTPNARPFLALVTAGLALVAGFAILLWSARSDALVTTPIECGIDPSRPTICRIHLPAGLALDIDTRDLVPGSAQGQFFVYGDIEIPTGGEPLVLVAAEAEFYQPSSSEVTLVNGTALMPFPTQGFLQHIEVTRTPMVSFGSDWGANLAFTGAPVHDDQRYFYFHMNSILEAGYGPISMTTPGGAATAVLDPSDPYFYFGGELVGLGGDDPKKDDDGSTSGQSGSDPTDTASGSTDPSGTDPNTQDPNTQDPNTQDPNGQDPGADPDDDGSIPSVGIGFSLNGRIPFTPLLTYGVEDDLPSFDGHLYVRGPIPIPAFPLLSLTGDAVLDVDPDQDGDHPFMSAYYDGSEFPDIALGGNGALSVGIPFLKFFEYGFDLGAATTVAWVTEADQRAVFTGEVGVDQSSFLGDLPVGIEAGGRIAMYGVFDTDLYASFIHGEGEMGLDPSGIGRLFGVDMAPVASADGKIDMNAAGLTVTGSTSASPLPGLVEVGQASVIAHVSPDGLDSYLALAGDFLIDTFELRDGILMAHLRDGVTVRGTVQIEDTIFGMDGSFAAAGYALRGTTTLADPIELNATEAIELADQLLQHEQSRQALEDSLAAAEIAAADARQVFDAALAVVNTAQSELNKVQNDLNYNISLRTSYYNSYRYWVNKSCKWYDAICKANRSAKISYYYGLYVYRAGLVVTLTAARDAARAALDVAEAALTGPQQVLAAAEASVSALNDQLDALAQVIADTKQRLDALPDLQGSLTPVVTVYIVNGQLSGSVVGDWNGQQITDGYVSFGANPEACLNVPTMGTLCSPL